MSEQSFSYGYKCAFLGGKHPSCSRARTAIAAQKEGFGFIQQNSFSYGKTFTTIWAWDIKVVSYQEALEFFKDNPKFLAEVESHYASRKSTVFLIAPAPEEYGGYDVFPFDLVNKLRVVKFSELLDSTLKI